MLNDKRKGKLSDRLLKGFLIHHATCSSRDCQLSDLLITAATEVGISRIELLDLAMSVASEQEERKEINV